MWAPTEVVPQHKKRATAVWVLFLLLIMSYTVWLFVDVAAKMKNPSVSITIEPERYEFPTLSVCFIPGSACDSNDTAYCLGTSRISLFNENGFNWTEHEANYFENITENSEVYRNCLDIRLGDIQEVKPELHYLPPSLLLRVIWNLDYLGNAAVEDMIQTVHFYITDPRLTPHGDHNETTFMGDIPYIRINPGDFVTSLSITNMMMEMTETITLSKTSTKAFAASSLLETEFNMFSEPFYSPWNTTIGWAMLQIRQPSLSHTVRREIHPLEWAEIFGNIGGCWELLLVLWGLLFVAVRAEEPRLMGRDFKSTGKRAVQSVRGVAVGIGRAATISRIRRMSSTSAGEDAEAIPAWDKEARLNAQRAAIPGPAFNPATNGTCPQPVMGFPLQPRESGPTTTTSGHSAPSDRQDGRPRITLSSLSFRSNSRRVAVRYDSNTSSRVEASTAHPVPNSFPVPNESKYEANEAKVEISSRPGHSPV